jgi:RNA polymerase sigma-70 factor, ECF subfamily
MSGGHSDKFLLGELRAGNSRAFGKVFKDYYPNLCRYATAIIRDEDKAQSLVQNVFVRLWENRASLDKVTSLSPYLVTMVRNESINYLKREKRNIKLDRLPDNEQDAVSVEDIIKESELSEKLVVAMGMLPDRCREAFEYSRYDSMTNREIAEKMEISLKGAEALITRSLKFLRNELSEYLPSAGEKKKNKDSAIL